MLAVAAGNRAPVHLNHEIPQKPGGPSHVIPSNASEPPPTRAAGVITGPTMETRDATSPDWLETLEQLSTDHTPKYEIRVAVWSGRILLCKCS